ncbi:MAG: right-handed parallel beta-helix repeat-containing protein [Candidatus Thorarchaeota archaeon]
MKNLRKLTLVFLALMFVLPTLIQLGAVNSTASIEPTKNYTESYVHHDQIWIQSNEEFSIQAAAESWAGDGSDENPYVITGYLFDCESQPLRIWHTTVHWTFTGNEIFGVGGAILCGSWIENVTHGAIVNNEIHNRHSALAMSDVREFTVTGNYIHDCWGNGIEFFAAGMSNTLVQDNIVENIGGAGLYATISSDCVVKNNTFTNIDNIGIALMGQSPNCDVIDNTISNTVSSGMIVSNPDNGIVAGNFITHADSQGIYLNTPIDCVISSNTITEVTGDGMRVVNAEFTEFSENLIGNCTENGFKITSGTNTSVHWNSVYNVSEYAVNLEANSGNFSVKFNTFIDNGVDCQVCDDGTSNLVSQNYYDDWSSPDADADGYVDTPYALDGDAESQDEFPLAVAGVVPTQTVTTSTTTSTGVGTPLPMDMVLIAGSVGAIILVAGILVLKRR